MRYISLFSGIGGFEYAIHQFYEAKKTSTKKPRCVGYSEIDKHAIAEYERHYPHHKNLGDITNLSQSDIDALGKIDLVVGGFPCNDLSSLNKNRLGLNGEKSGLFWTMLDILKWVKNNNPNLKIIIENNASMAHRWRDVITEELESIFQKPVFCNFIDSSKWVLQRRRRYYWTLRKIPGYEGERIHDKSQVFLPTTKSLNELRIPDKVIRKKNEPYSFHGNSGLVWNTSTQQFTKVDYITRWKSSYSKSSDDFIKCVTTVRNDNILLDLRPKKSMMRYFSKKEIARLFGFPDDYIDSSVPSIFYKLFGMSVVPIVINYILQHI